jgi:uncharacterized protein (TIGR04255 family)
MEFPQQPRAVYKRNPLVEVVCQLRFPRILLLDRQVPAEFQMALGKEFPGVASREEVRLSFSEGAPNPTPMSRRQVYDFSTSDSKYTVSLCSDFLAVQTKQYERWEGFQDVLKSALEALKINYDPAHFNRIGLRYINVLDKSDLGLEDYSWSSLLRGTALGLLSEPDVPLNDLKEQSSTSVIQLDKGRVALRTGLNFRNPDGAPCFVVDSDFFCEDQVEGAEHAIDGRVYRPPAPESIVPIDQRPTMH